MRGLRSTVALLFVLIGLFAYIYFVTWKQPEAGSETARDRVFAALDADKIDEIRITSASGETTAVRKQDSGWQITAPLTTKADTSEIASITSNLSSLEVTRVVDENPSDLKEYGLDAPVAEVEFKASSDKNYAESRKLLLGEKSPTGSDVFAKRDGETRVILIPGYTEPIFNRSTFNLRDKTLVAFERDKLDRVTVTTGGARLEFAKEGTDWRLTRPIAAAADAAAVDALVTKIQTAAMKSVVTEQAAPADLKKYGFDNPQATITLNAGSTATLVIGGKLNEQESYARDPAKPLVATIDSMLLTDLTKSPDEFRRKDIFAFTRYTGTRLEFVRDSQTIVFEKVKQDGQPDKWHRISPTAGDPETASMEGLLTAIESMRATSFLPSAAKTGLDKPALSVSATFEDGKRQERIAFARTGTDAYAAVPGQPGAAVIPPTAYDDLIKALDVVSK